MRLEERAALVTGAAKGIGRAVARRLSAEGARVVVADRDGDGAAAVAEELREAGAVAHHEQVDVSVGADVDRLVRRTVEQLGVIDVLVNNAGILEVTDLLEIESDEWQRVLGVNVLGTFRCLQSAAREMVRQATEGAIVNMSSVIGRHGHEHLGTYGASKAAVLNITRSASQALGRHGIRVNAVCPGIVDTAMWDIADARYAELENVPVGTPRRERIERVPLGRAGTPEDVAGVVAFLVSSDAAYVTGQAINVCGGTSFA